MNDFQTFSHAVNAQFNTMSKGELFNTGLDSRALETVYLAAFPAGTNPIYKTNTEHDCSCCKHFIRNIGSAVALKNNKYVTVWDVEGLPYPYDVVAKTMADFVRSQPILCAYRTEEPQYGVEANRQALEDGNVKVWNHFFGSVAARHYGADKAATQIGEHRAGRDVLQRGLLELASDDLQAVLDLIDGDQLYRGAEHRAAVAGFQQLLHKYAALPADEQVNFVWANATERSARFRNTVIGTLVQDLSSGVPLEQAVKSFEAKVAPTNYKRTTSLVTPRMVQAAVKTLTDMGLEHSIERRLANIGDVTINNVLWVAKSARGQLKNSLLESVADSLTTAAPLGKPTDIGIEAFMRDVLPTAASLEMLVKNQHKPNFMTLTAPVHADSGRIFKWDNDFAWSYVGNITDSIKDRVKTAGGNTNAALRISLAWFNHDDLDLHCHTPNGNHHYFGTRHSTWGRLDVDMNAGMGTTRTPVENIAFRESDLQDGKYVVIVNQYSQREASDVGFELEVEYKGSLHHYTYHPRVQASVNAFTINLEKGKMTITIGDSNLVEGSSSQEVWGISTEKLVKVDTVMYSPNYWDDNATGNKHWFFMLHKCKTDMPARGIYNEFLRSDLEQHRKVFETLGDRTKCPYTPDQLSGVGFSSTKRDEVVVVATTATSKRTYNVIF